MENRTAAMVIAAALVAGCAGAYEGPNDETDTKDPKAHHAPPSGSHVVPPERGPSSTGSGKPTSDAGAPPNDEGHEASAPPNLCKVSGAAIYAFHSGDKWAWSGNNVPPAGFQKDSTVLRLALAGADNAPKATLYVLHSAQADDYMLSTNPNEGSSLGYSVKETLGTIYTSAQPGAVPLHRYVKPSPLRHYASIESTNIPSGFSLDGTEGFACPL